MAGRLSPGGTPILAQQSRSYSCSCSDFLLGVLCGDIAGPHYVADIAFYPGKTARAGTEGRATGPSTPNAFGSQDDEEFTPPLR